jgi:hypothetical protein
MRMAEPSPTLLGATIQFETSSEPSGAPSQALVQLETLDVVHSRLTVPSLRVEAPTVVTLHDV